ncbi:MAG: extracellular solute-binding protein [Clostridia bacterium]|nr:extracellular solute-binding protein [Clostridia bacterium]
MTIKRLSAALLAVMIVVLSLAGCKEDDRVDPFGATLRTMTILGDSDTVSIYSSLLSEFSASNPELYLQDTTAAQSDAFKLNATIEDTYTSGKAPHVLYYYNNTGIDDLRDYFVPVDEIRADYPDFASGIPDALLSSLSSSDGHTYCIPAIGDSTALAVNEKLIDGAAPDSWDTFVTAVANTRSQCYAIANSPDDSAAFIESLVISYGGYDAVKQGLARDKDALREFWLPALRLYNSMCNTHSFAPAAHTDAISKYVAANEWESVLPLDSIETMNSGIAAMLLLDSSDVPRLSIDGDIAIKPMPTPPDGAFGSFVIVSYDAGFYITREAYSDPLLRDAAVAYVDYMTSAKACAALSGIGAVPANELAVSDDAILSQFSQIVRSSESCIPTSRTASNESMWREIESYAAQMYFGIITPEQMIELLGDASLTTEDIVPLVSDSDVSASDAEVSSGDVVTE